MPSGIYDHTCRIKQACIRGHIKTISGKTKSGGCLLCSRLQASIWRRKNPNKAAIKGKNDRYYKNHIVNIDGSRFTTVDYDRQYQIQCGKCAGCSRHSSELDRGLHADHDHKTGIFRFLLCGPCNQTIGLVHENSKILRKLASLLDNDSNALNESIKSI